MDALRFGAVDVLGKPSSTSIGDIDKQLVFKIKAAAQSKIYKQVQEKAAFSGVGSNQVDLKKVILIGASTGGPESLSSVIHALPERMPPICVVQHIPAVFSAAFAQRLDSSCRLKVKEAKDGDLLEESTVYIAPGDYHMMLKSANPGYKLELSQGPKICYQRPAVDVLFKSAARILGKNAVAGIMTGNVIGRVNLIR